jgi:FkbM family methyltransferase
LEVPIIFEQITSYSRHGFDVKEGDTIFDVGANIGLFSLTACDWGRRSVKIFAFEPIPATFRALKANAERHQLREFVPLQYAVSRQRGEETFTYYPLAMAMSTAHPYDVDSDNVLKRGFRNILPQLPRFLRWIERLPPRPQAVTLRLLLKIILHGRRVACRTISLSDAIREHGIDQVDLIKIDVEKAEFEVLQGIDPPDWKKVQKIVIEVHDIEGRLNAVVDVLRSHGLQDVVCQQEPEMKEFGVFTVFARRRTGS